MRTLNTLSVRLKVIGAMGVLILSMLGLGAYAIREAGLINASAAEIRTNWLPSVHLVGELAYASRNVAAKQWRYTTALSFDPDNAKPAEQELLSSIAKLDAAYTAYKPQITSDTIDVKLMAEFEAIWTKAKALDAKAMELAHTGTP